jgi:hypothetical protein
MMQDRGISAGTWPVIPVRYKPIDEDRVPERLRFLQGLDAGDPARADRALDRLIRALQSPLPQFAVYT